ncbi:MAG: hypothetical protein R3B70_16320 [Polyangiaceae bacterium]
MSAAPHRAAGHTLLLRRSIMKSTHQCPKCTSRQLWLIQNVYQQSHGTPDYVVVPISVTAFAKKARPARRTQHGVNALAGDSVTVVGRFDIFVCAHCGFTEWYAQGANEALAQIAAEPDSNVKWIDSTGQTPYR